MTLYDFVMLERYISCIFPYKYFLLKARQPGISKEMMWGCDLTPLYEETGGRLMFFTAFLPLGLQFTLSPRGPNVVGGAEVDLIVVDNVEAKSEGETLGIRRGDVLRAVSYVKAEEPEWLDKMLGAEAMPMKKVSLMEDVNFWVEQSLSLLSGVTLFGFCFYRIKGL